MTLKENMTYDPMNRLTRVSNTKGDSTLSVYSYQYDNNGNITSVTEQLKDGSPQTSTYSYDKLSRLTGVKRADGSETAYTYDLRGNRLTQKDTRDLPDEKAANYRYDLQNTLISVTKDSVKTALDYLPDGLRWKKTSGSKVTQYSYNGANQVIGDQTSSGTISSYIRGDRVLVKKDLTNQKDYYYLYNGHGDVVQMVGTDGSLVNSYNYDEWGNLTQQKETVANEFKYAGETYDAETGLYYLKARYYDPNIGRFLNEDTVEGQINNPLTMNIYTYTTNNPLIFTDPTGHANYKYGSKEYGAYAHYALQARFSYRNLFSKEKIAFTEVSIKLTNGDKGRADFVLKVGGRYEVSELKPISYYTNKALNASGKKQLQGYVDGINENGLILDKVNQTNALASKGTVFNPDGETIRDPFDSTKLIKFYTYPEDPGMIYYASVKNPSPREGLVVIPEPSIQDIRDSIAGMFKDFFSAEYHPNGTPLPNGLPPLGGDKGFGGYYPIPIPRIPLIP